mmetsp:Transcript_57941/g.109141  ORF Transcript_57941/g.109141 Transcript_57941/m.109141 type:complete len:365 (+) Transcript_57941:151-1245(+)
MWQKPRRLFTSLLYFPRVALVKPVWGRKRVANWTANPGPQLDRAVFRLACLPAVPVVEGALYRQGRRSSSAFPAAGGGRGARRRRPRVRGLVNGPPLLRKPWLQRHQFLYLLLQPNRLLPLHDGRTRRPHAALAPTAASALPLELGREVFQPRKLVALLFRAGGQRSQLAERDHAPAQTRVRADEVGVKQAHAQSQVVEGSQNVLPHHPLVPERARFFGGLGLEVPQPAQGFPRRQVHHFHLHERVCQVHVSRAHVSAPHQAHVQRREAAEVQGFAPPRLVVVGLLVEHVVMHLVLLHVFKRELVCLRAEQALKVFFGNRVRLGGHVRLHGLEAAVPHPEHAQHVDDVARVDSPHPGGEVVDIF